MDKLIRFETDIWGRYHIEWNEINPDVNILVGINGAGKTTLLDKIFAAYKNEKNCIYIPSIDNMIVRDKRKSAKAIVQNLEYYFYDTKTGPSLMKMRAGSYDNTIVNIEKVKEHELQFERLLNKMFVETGKTIDLKASTPPVVIEGKRFPLDVLSSGEQQLMLIFLQIHLLMGQEALVLMDEPENMLHISWQSELINILTELNPNAQYIITTHSPSIFGDGWGDKVTYMDNILKLK